jgi:hypothetical protein
LFDEAYRKQVFTQEPPSKNALQGEEEFAEASS